MSLWDPRGSAYPRHTIRHRHSLKRTALRVLTDAETLSRLLTQDELDRSLDRTRALSDRTSSQFVFLRLTVGFRGNAAYVRREWLLVVGEEVLRRCRRSDVAGWHTYDRGAVGIILPDTDFDGALRVVSDIEKAFRHRGQQLDAVVPDLVCEVYVYPSQAGQSGRIPNTQGSGEALQA